MEKEEEQVTEDAGTEVKVVALETSVGETAPHAVDANEAANEPVVDPAPIDDAETTLAPDTVSPGAEQAASPAPSEDDEAGGGGEGSADDSVFSDLMDIFETEDMVDPAISIPGLETLTMNEVAAETDNVAEELRSRFLS